MISRSSIHALRALAVLSRLPDGSFLGAGSLAETADAPPNYLGKLLQTLSRSSVLVSRKGTGGGFALARPAGEITLFEALEPVEDFDRWKGCFLGNPVCTDEAACSAHAGWAPVRDRYLAFLRNTTLQDLGTTYGEPAP